MENNNSLTILNLLNEEHPSLIIRNSATIAQGIQSGNLTVVQLIEHLKHLLLHSSPLKRKHGVVILTEILKNLPPDFLSLEQLRIISTFYTDKLSDHHEVLPSALLGILTVIKLKNFPEDNVSGLLNGLFYNVSCQQQQQADRYNVYSIFKLLLKNHRKEVLLMGLDFVYGIMSSIDGERDPRNLLFLFQWLKTFFKTVSLGNLLEEMFEVISCYFPVDFRMPPIGINSDITRETLAEALCLCLCAITDFGKYCIPLALEKLNSSSQVAKTDSLKLLQEGCNAFNVSVYIQHSSKIWSQIQKGVFSGGDEEMKIECLKTLTIVTKKMSQTEDKSCKDGLKDIFNTLKGNILLESKLFTASLDILYSIALASQSSSMYMFKETVPLLINSFAITVPILQKIIILKFLIKFVTAFYHYNDDVDLKENEEFNTIYLLCLKASTADENNLKAVGFDCLSNIVQKLPLDIRIPLYKNLHRVLLKPQEQQVQISAINCFKNLSVSYQDEINRHVLYNTKINDPISLDLYFKALSEIANLNYFKEIVTNNMLNYAVDNIPLAAVAIKNIKTLLENNLANASILEVFLIKDTISKLVEYSITQVTVNGNLSFQLLLDIASVLKILIGIQNYETQCVVIQQQLNVIDSYKEHSEDVYILLLDGLITRIRKGLRYDRNILEALLKGSLTNGNDLVREVAMQLLANLINKQPEDESLYENLDVIKDECLQYYENHKSNVIFTISWVTKALVMRNHCQQNFWIELLLQKLEHESEVGKGFRIIVNDNYEALSSVSYSNKTLLYQQRMFVLTSNKIVNYYESRKLTFYLFAIGYMLEYTPDQIILLQFNKIIKLIKHCLDRCKDQDVIWMILKKLKNFILINDPRLHEHLRDLLSRIVELSTCEYSMNIRIAALECLINYALLPLYRILAYQETVLRQLEFSINDRKRLVRRKAVEARSLWFLLDSAPF